ncbi:MAG: type II toxin-antitoxin system VapC family toxin [Acidimicrobiia bacterium]
MLDTTVLIDHLRRDRAATQFLVALSAVPWCSELTRVEVTRGLRSAERADAERLFAQLGWMPVTERLARAAGELGRRFRRSHTGISTVDLVIAATATDLGLPVATQNVGHFPMFRGLRPPY